MIGSRDPAAVGVMPSQAANAAVACAAIEDCLRGWLPPLAFVKAAAIAAHPILPEEQALVARAVERRQHEFATGRWLARQGLRHLGHPDSPIGMGRLRNPIWPAGILGSLSHDGDVCAAVLLSQSSTGIGSIDGIGVDLIDLAARAGRMADLAAMFVASAGECAAVAPLATAVDPATLLFSLKESVVKAMSVRLGDFIDLRAIDIRPGAVRILGNPVDIALKAASAGPYLVTLALVGSAH
jgi:enterobactin synthetase component D